MPTIESLLDHDNPEFAALLKEATDAGAGLIWITYMRIAFSLGGIAADTKALKHIDAMRKEMTHAE